MLSGGSVSGCAGLLVRCLSQTERSLVSGPRRLLHTWAAGNLQHRQSEAAPSDRLQGLRIVYLHLHLASPVFLFALGLFGLFWGFLKLSHPQTADKHLLCSGTIKVTLRLWNSCQRFSPGSVWEFILWDVLLARRTLEPLCEFGFGCCFSR